MESKNQKKSVIQSESLYWSEISYFLETKIFRENGKEKTVKRF